MRWLNRIGPWQGVGILAALAVLGGLLAAPAIQAQRQTRQTLQDQRRYAAALSLPPDAAAVACREIGEVRLRGECLAGAAGALGAAGEPICQEMHAGAWRDECFFLVSQSIAGTDAEAVRLCKLAGRFASHCQGHAVRRAAQAREIPLGGEPAALQTIVRLAAQLSEGSTDEQSRRLAIDILSGRLAERWTGPPDQSGCGEAPPHVCVRAARTAIRMQGIEAEFCQDPAPWVQQVCRTGAGGGLSAP